MAENTSIEWCDHTWTPVVGCDAKSPACANCYAALIAARLEAMGNEKYAGVAVRAGGKGKWTGKVNFSEVDLIKPLQVRKPGRWFLTSMGDVAHDAVTDEQIAEMFGVMAVAGAAGPFHREQDGCTPQKSNDGTLLAKWPNMLSGPHTFMVLTKRPERLSRLLLDSRFRKLVAQSAHRWAHNRTDAGYLSGGMYPFESDRDQQRADELRPYMAAIAASGWKTFVSYEPALGPVDWTGWEFLKQLISGGESGPKARPSHPEWHRTARDFAFGNGIAYLFKQWGQWLPADYSPDASEGRPEVEALEGCGELPHQGNYQVSGIDGQTVVRVGKKAAGRLLDGRTWDEVPR